jgi:large subunit ribosomal protein L32e
MKFVRHAAHRKKRLGDKWRKPKGLHNKMRDQKKGARPMVKSGYRTAVETRGQAKGLVIVNVYNKADLAGLDKQKHGVVIGRVGKKLKVELLEAVQKAGLKLLTGDPAQELKRLEEERKERKKSAEERQKEREERQKELEKLAAEKEKAEEPEEAPEKPVAKKAAKKTAKKAAEANDSPEEKTKEEQEKDKVLTKAR